MAELLQGPHHALPAKIAGAVITKGDGHLGARVRAFPTGINQPYRDRSTRMNKHLRVRMSKYMCVCCSLFVCVCVGRGGGGDGGGVCVSGVRSAIHISRSAISFHEAPYHISQSVTFCDSVAL